MQMTSTSTLILCDSHMRKIHLIIVNSIAISFIFFLTFLGLSQKQIEYLHCGIHVPSCHRDPFKKQCENIKISTMPRISYTFSASVPSF